jgi:hypothetical protein
MLETDFKSIWYIREGTYVRDFLESKDELFPTAGISGAVYIANVDLATEMDKVVMLSEV